MKRTLSFLLAFLILAVTVFSSGCSGGKFDFCDSNMERYVTFSLSDFTGKTIKLKGAYPAITKETAIHEFDFARFVNADSTLGEGSDLYLSVPEWGDCVYIFYDLTTEEGGASVGSNLFGESGAQSAYIGAWEFKDMLDRYESVAEEQNHPIFTSKVLSDALLETMPATRVFPAETDKEYAQKGDYILLSYSVSEENQNTVTYDGAYIDTSNEEAFVREFGEDFYNALTDGTRKTGESYTVNTTKKDKNDKDVAVKYTFKILSVLEETYAEEGDVLFLSYILSYDDESEKPKAVYNVRIDTAEKDFYVARYGEAFYNSLVNGENLIGETYELHTSIKGSDEKDHNVTYTVTMQYIAEEDYQTVAIDLAEDAFDASYSEALRALNGTRVYLSFYVHHYEDYVVPALDAEFLASAFGYTSNEKDPEKLKEEAIDAMVNKLSSEREEKIKEEAFNTFWTQFYTPTLVKRIPNDPYLEQYNYIITTIEDAYRKDYNEAQKSGEKFPYADINEYAANYTNPPYSLEEFPTLKDYAATLAEETVSERVVVFAMAQMASTRMTSIALKQTYDEVIADYAESFKNVNGFEGTVEQIITAVTGGAMTTEEEFEWYVLWTITRGELIDYIYENNTWDYKTE